MKEKERLALYCNVEVTESNCFESSSNTEIENSDNGEKKGEGEAEEIPTYFGDPALNSMFLSCLEYRKECGKEVKGKAIDYCIEKLEVLSKNPKEQIAIIKQTIQNGWTDFFPLKVQKEKGSCVSLWLENESVQNVGGAFSE